VRELAQLLNEMKRAGVIRDSIGRVKDFTRILALLKSGSASRESIECLAARHGLADAWQRFESRFLNE
jgi:hypothetical protein